MTPYDLLKQDAEAAYNEVTTALEGVTEAQAWSVLANNGPDYLHTSGSIYSIVLHLAGVKWMYANICFRQGALRWRDIADQIEAFEPSYSAAVDYLQRGHQEWMESWANIEDLEAIHPSHWKGEWPAWKILQRMAQHDAYHAGQIVIFRYANPETDVKPISEAEDLRRYCRDLPHW